jgi:hypothetical protein
LAGHVRLDCVICVAVGDVIADPLVNCWFKFGLDPIRSFTIFSCCTLCYARYLIAKCASLPFEKAELFQVNALSIQSIFEGWWASIL